jgi:hypothetical protein
MAPIFTRNSVDRVIETFPLSISTWGLDYAWSRLFRGNRMYVLDSEVMNHLGKPDLIDGPFYRYLSSIGKDPRIELRHLMSVYGCDDLVIGNTPPLIDGLLYGKSLALLRRLRLISRLR